MKSHVPLIAFGLGWLLTGAGPPLRAQEAAPRYASRLWTAEHGLPMNQVVDIDQTGDGYLWLATFGGIVRFDGLRFTVYDGASHPDLPSARIQQIEVARDGAIVGQTEFGHVVRLFGGEIDVLVPGDHLAGDLSAGLWKDGDGRIWVGTTEDLGYVSGDSLVSAFPSPPGWPVRTSLRAFDELWVGTQDGQLHAVGPEGTRTVAPLPGNEIGFWSQVSALEVGPDGHLYIGTFHGLYRLDSATREITEVHATSVAELLTSRDGTRLVSSGNHLVEIDAVGGIRELAADAGTGRSVRALWSETGVLWHTQEQTVFRDGVPVFEIDSWVDVIFEDAEGSIWLGGPSGLVQLTGAVFTTLAPPEALQRAVCSDEAACAAGFGVYAITEDPFDDGVWIGTLHHGTWRVADDGTFHLVDSRGTFSIHPGVEGVVRGGYQTGLCSMVGSGCEPIRGSGLIVRAIDYDDEGTLWVGTDQGLSRFDDGQLTRYSQAEGLPHEHVFSVVPAESGAVWVGTLDGVARIGQDRVESLSRKDGFDAGAVRTLHLAEGVAWAGTESKGLFRIEPRGSLLRDAKVTHYGRSDGLYSDGVHTILDDGHGRMWMSSNQGIFWIRAAELDAFARGEADRIRSVVYLERDGLANREANGGTTSAGMRASDGRLWFATMGGAAVVDPAAIDRGRVTLQVAIETVTSGTESLHPSLPIELAADQRDFEIEYTAPSFVGAENMRFRYRLEGYDADWVDAGMRRTAFYTNVPAGRHVFRVAAEGYDGTWTEAAAPLMIRVLPRYYEQPWFLPFVGFLMLAAGVGVLRWRERLHVRRTVELSGLVRERTSQLEAEKEESERARTAAERAESTARKALTKVADQARRLEELDRAKSRFFTNVSHELRTPLTLTIGPLEDLRDGVHGDIHEEAREELDLALRNSNRLLRMVNQILDVAKLEAGQLALRPVEADLAELVASVVQAFAPLAERREIDLSSEGLDEPVMAIIDPDQFEKVILNLLSNAFKFTSPGGSVAVALSTEDHVGTPCAVLQVTDTGIGIDESLQSAIFDRFYQGRERPESPIPGTGIGLSLARELVELHLGRIEVESTPGEGSSFTVRIPTRSLEASENGKRSGRASAVAVEPPEVQASHPADTPVDRDDDPRLTVLVVDDNAEIRHYVRRHLAPRYRVLEAGDGRTGLDMAKTEMPDLVLSDVMMPGMTGDELCHAIKADPELEFVPVVLLTAKASPDSRIRGFAVGADDYLTKPFSMHELRARIGNLIGRRQRLTDRMRKAEIVSTGVPADATSMEERFLANVRRTIIEHLGDEEFGVEALAEALGHSRAHLYRRLGDLQGRSPAKLIRLMRLERAAELLKVEADTVSAIAHAVGFKSVSHFSRAFRQQYGVTPSEYGRNGEDR